LPGKLPSLPTQSFDYPGRVFSFHLDQHREPGLALDQCGDVGVVDARDQVALPVARDRTVLDLGRALANRDGIDDLTT
jgi:hypothetical protein